MPISTQVTLGISGGGSAINSTLTRETDAAASREVSMPAGNAGSLTTRTDDNTGTITLGAGHTIQTGDIVDIYWATGVQYKVTVGTVSGTSVPFDVGIGGVLPAQGTAVVMTERIQINADIDGDLLSCIGFMAGATGHVDFQDVGSAEIAQRSLVANVPQVWDITGGSLNPFTGNIITKLFVSNGISTAANIFKLIWAVDSTP